MEPFKPFEHLIAELPEPLHILDADGRIVFWNRGAELLYGFSSREAIGQPSDDLLGITRSDSESANVYHWDAADADRWVGELDAVTKSGQAVRIQRRITRIRDGVDRKGSVVFDLEAEQPSRLDETNRRRQRLESLGSLASGIAHDLNNLLTPILMSCKMLQRADPNIDREALLDTISSGAKRGAELIAQLLTFAQGGEGTHKPIRIDSFLPEVSEILRRAIPGSIRLTVDIAESLPQVMGDETEISQVVMNLAINARDAMPHGGELSIRVRTEVLQVETSFSTTILPAGEYVAIEVADTGTGIPREICDRIFDPFFSTKQRGRGTGLGLSTTIGIVKSHGGAIGIKSMIDQGTTMTVLLPTYHPESSPP
jgi:PAS domain S-box-containing protein